MFVEKETEIPHPVKPSGQGNSWGISCKNFTDERPFPSNRCSDMVQGNITLRQNERGERKRKHSHASRQTLPSEEGFSHVMNHDSLLC
jgi:hypothetical protein